MGGGRSNIYSTFFCSFTKLAFTVFAIALHILDSEAQILYQRYQKISPQKTPAVWIEIDEWPLTGSGKIKKYALREQLSAGLLHVLT